MKKTEFSPQHLPRGTVIETCLYRRCGEGEHEIVWHNLPTDKPARFTVDHILAVPYMSDFNYIVVTTTANPNDPIFYDTIQFNISHVDRIVKRGDKTIIKLDRETNAPYKEHWSTKNNHTSLEIRMWMSWFLSTRIPLGLFNFSRMFDQALACGVVRRVKCEGSYPIALV